MAKRKSSAAVKARLKALRRKHGLGEFRKKSAKKQGFSTKTSRKRSFSMARRRRRSSSRRGGAFGPITKVLIGGFIYGVIRTPINTFTKGFLGTTVSDEIGMLLINGLIANFTTGQIRNAALIGIGIEASTLAKNFNLGGIVPAPPPPIIVGAGAVVI